MTNPVANGIPVRALPEELLAEPKADKVPLRLALLRQDPPEVYRLAAGDLLGLFVDGVLGQHNELPPVHVSENSSVPSAMGFPILVRENGTIALPLAGSVSVEGTTLHEAEQAIIHAYTVRTKVIAPGRERVIVTLMRPRQTRVLVIREDSATSSGGASRSLFARGTVSGGNRKGTGTVVELPAYQNDVLNALANTGGLPGTDAVNEIVIQRGYTGRAGQDGSGFAELGEEIRIPLRVSPGEPLPFGPEDILLHTGDIVLVEARESELFYTAGLLPSAEHSLPRDRDLSVVEAVTLVGGPLINGGFAGNNLSGTLVSSGIGNPSPSLLTVVRRMEDGSKSTIRVDLNRAVSDPREDLLLKPGDLLVLQETPHEAFTRYLTSVLDILYIHSDDAASVTVAGP